MSNLFVGLEHIGIKTKDLEKGILFYTQVLGFTLVNRMKPGDAELVFLRLGETVIELVESKEGDLGDGVVNHIALRVPDIFAAADYLKFHGVECVSSEPMPIGESKYNFFFRGPSGEKLELIQG